MQRARELLCPYCFTRWSTHVAAFRCLSTDEKRCPKVPDEAQGRLRGIDAPMENRVLVHQGRIGMAFTPKTGKPVRCECGAATYPVCPSCHSRLPQLFTQSSSTSMALIGTKDSGKSHYVTVVLHELDHRVGPRLNGSLMLLDEYTRDRMRNELLPRLYKQRMVLDPTQGAASDVTTRLPLAARLSLGAGKVTHDSNLIFFDAAGEDLQSLSTLEREARYVTQSDGVIVIIDPLQIPSIRDELNGSVELPEVSQDANTMLMRVAALMREARGVPPQKRIEVPLALVVSKLDAIRELLPDTHPALTASPLDGAFDRRDARNVNDTVRADLAAWLGEGFDRFVQQTFSNVGHFAVSALGGTPSSGRLDHGVAPHRVEDPVLWMLDQWHAVPFKDD
jgi:Double-GTPase 2